MRKLLPAFVLFIVTTTAKAQQLHFTSQYLQHNAMYNPAAAGISNKNMVGVSYRSMWSSFPGNPKTFMVYADADLKKLNAGLGGYIYRDETGPTSRTGLQLAYSYHIKSRNEKNKFGIGLELRALQYAIDKSKLSASLGNDPILAGSKNKTAIDAGFGLYWTNSKLSVGGAAQQLIGSKVEFANIPGAKENGRLYRHYNFTANYKLQTGDDIYVIPNFMTRIVENSPTEFNFGVKVDYQEKLWWGLNWQIRQFWSLQAGFKILQRVSATYSYDYYTTPISVFSAGSGAHEIGLQFDLKKK
ncbi:MAG: PorP/SprF family type IX secretion system membrane protein [Ferruginibacter sp.]|nr:PorP/SprF family type IX secretion system membrane protein [Ferruginibacter sp.]